MHLAIVLSDSAFSLLAVASSIIVETISVAESSINSSAIVCSFLHWATLYTTLLEASWAFEGTDSALVKQLFYARQLRVFLFVCFLVKKSMGFSLCLGCEVSKWHLNLFGFVLAEANILGQTTHRGLSSLPTVALVKLKARYASSYFLHRAQWGSLNFMFNLFLWFLEVI